MKTFRIKYNAKNGTYTFACLSDKAKTKKGFKFCNHFARSGLGGNSVAIYENQETEEVAIVHEYCGRNTSNNPKFFSCDEWNRMLDKLAGVNAISNLGIILNRYFECKFTYCDDEKF